MAKPKKKARAAKPAKPEDDRDEEAEDRDDDDEDALLARDYVMARLSAARVAAADALTSIDECLACYVHPEEDKSGKDRVESAEEFAEDANPRDGEPDEDEED